MWATRPRQGVTEPYHKCCICLKKHDRVFPENERLHTRLKVEIAESVAMERPEQAGSPDCFAGGHRLRGGAGRGVVYNSGINGFRRSRSRPADDE